MTKLEKDRLIEKFMGWDLRWSNKEGERGWSFFNGRENKYLHGTIYQNSTVGYTTDWNRLMEALKKFDEEIEVEFSQDLDKFLRHARLCDQIDYAVTLYNIDDAVNALCEGIEWYNSTLN